MLERGSLIDMVANCMAARAAGSVPPWLYTLLRPLSTSPSREGGRLLLREVGRLVLEGKPPDAIQLRRSSAGECCAESVGRTIDSVIWPSAVVDEGPWRSARVCTAGGWS